MVSRRLGVKKASATRLRATLYSHIDKADN
jgi:hypothetical protein